ncbi:MAG: hypothetical protein N2Z72_01500 [Bacteroidales bacterium]|nr:hypothetical protein [Bacteroidales bacterium]
MKKFIWLTLFISTALLPQELLLFEREFSYSFNFSPTRLQDSTLNQTFLKTMGKYMNKSHLFISYNLHCYIHHKLYKIDTTFYRIQLTMKNISWNGDIFYRSISLNPVLLPFKTKFKVLYSSRQKTELVELISHEQALVNQLGYVELLNTLIPQTLISDITYIKADSFYFYYDSLSLANLNVFIKQIDDYYHTTKKLMEIDSTVRTFFLDSLEMLPLYHIEFKYLSNQIKEIHEKDFFNSLHLWENDPLEFTSKLNRLTQTLTEKQNMVARNLSNYELLLYNKALREWPISEKRSVEHFKKILAFNSLFTPALLRLSEYWLNKNNPDSAFHYFSQTLKLVIPDSLQNLAQTTGQRLYQLITQKASQAIQDQEYFSALTLLSQDSILCQHSFQFCDETWQKLIAKAHYGIYQSFITVAKKAMNSRKNTIAYHILKQAWNYQKTFQVYILTNIEVKDLFTQLRNNLLAEIKEEMKMNLFTSAQLKLSIVDTISRFYLVKNTDSINEWEKDISLLRFVLDIERINQFYQRENYIKGDSLFSILYSDLSFLQLSADSFLKENFKKTIKWRIKSIFLSLSNPEISLKNQRKLFLELNRIKLLLDSNLSMEQTLPEISEKLLTQEINYLENWLHHTDSFRLSETYLNYLDSLVSESQNIRLGEEIKLLLEKYYLKKCSCLSQHILLDSLSHFFTLHLFYKAITFLQLIPASLEKEKCYKEANYWYNKIDSIKKIFSFFDYLKNVEKNILQNMNLFSWNDFFYQYLQVENNITKLRLDTMNITLKPLPQWVAEKKNFTLIDLSFYFFFDSKNYFLALQLIKEMNKQNILLKYTKKYQKKLGEAMAARDILSDVTDYRKQCLTYTMGNSYLKYFRKSYFKVWKLHKK